MAAYIELSIRIFGVALLVLMIAMLLRDAMHVRSARYGVLLCICVAAIFMAESTGYRLGPAPLIVLTILSASTAITIWWFALSLFDDDFRLGRLHWAVAAVWTSMAFVNVQDYVMMRDVSAIWANHVRTVIALGIVLHIFYKAFVEAGDDLVERRRQIRSWFAAVVAGLFLVDLLSGFVAGEMRIPIAWNAVMYAIYCAVIFWAFLWLGRIDPGQLTFETPAPKHGLNIDGGANDDAETAQGQASVSDAKSAILQRRLEASLTNEKAYLDPDLSIGGLGERLAIPEHQLRALINQKLGYRNFRTFLNGYRLEHAKSTLADPEKAALPILTIAMDSGFSSLSSFNRLFKAETGETPSVYRNKALQKTAKDSEDPDPTASAASKSVTITE